MMCSKFAQCLSDIKALIFEMIATSFTQCWMVPSILSLIMGVGFSVAAAQSDSWIHLECVGGTRIHLGISHACLVNRTNKSEITTECQATEDYEGWLYSAKFLVYTAVTLCVLCTIVTSLYLCTPPGGNVSSLTMALAGISLVPAILLLLVLMDITSVNNSERTLDKALQVIQQTFHYKCIPMETEISVRTGTGFIYCGVAAACMLCSSIWSFVMSCVMRNNTHSDVNRGYKASTTKLVWRHRGVRGNASSRHDDVIWNDKFCHNTTFRSSPETPRKNSMFVNDSILNIFGH